MFEYKVSIRQYDKGEFILKTQPMFSKTPTGKHSKGIPSLEVCNNRLRIRFRVNGQQKTLYLGLADTPENRVKGEAIARQMHHDMLHEGYFDNTLLKYKPQSHLTVVESIKPKEALNLGQLWKEYETFKTPQLKDSTKKTSYRRFRNKIKELPTQSLDDAIAIRDHLMNNNSSNTAKRTITNISACCDWAVDSGKIKSNPFKGMAEKIKVSKSDNEETDIDPFSREERDLIIEAFENNKYYSYYAPYIKFCFFCGCRPSEAIALQWKHIQEKFILFEQAIVAGKLQKGLKTQRNRKFPINAQLREILESVRHEIINPEEFIFKSKEGQFIDIGDFLNHAWKGYKNRHGTMIEGIVTKLVREGKVSYYRKPYQTRHTFITLCLDAGGIDVKDVARWVGNSPEVIYKHYAGNKRDLQVPEL